MQLAYVDICGFRGYRNPVRVDFAPGFTVIDGRNGVGKSTLCDALEFALTQKISRPGAPKAAGESIHDYFWWRGEIGADDYYVKVGFLAGDGSKHEVVRRRGEEKAEGLERLNGMLFDPSDAPSSPLEQLCRSTIIRDEHIAALSLDLSESERFQFLRDALGAIEADEEIKRAELLKRECEKRRKETENAVARAREEFTTAVKRIDEIRSVLSDETALMEAAESLKRTLEIQAPLEGLASLAREAIGPRRVRIEKLKALAHSWSRSEASRGRLSEIEPQISALQERIAQLDESVDAVTRESKDLDTVQTGEKAELEARLLIELAALGERLGLHESQCPLCSAPRSLEEFGSGLAHARSRAKELNRVVTELAGRQREFEERLSTLGRERQSLTAELGELKADAQTCRTILGEACALQTELNLPIQ